MKRRATRGRRRSLLWGALAAAATAVAVAGFLAGKAEPVTVHVRTVPQFEQAVAQLRSSGGTVVLLPHAYSRTLVVGPRSARLLRVVGGPGVEVGRLVLDRTQRVEVGGLTVTPQGKDAWVRVSGSRNVDLHDLHVTAAGTRLSATVDIPNSRGVAIRRSTFAHCGDRAPRWSNCLRLRSRSSRILVADSWFHDCRGCDFVHGRFRSDLTVRGNRFERALPCRASLTRSARTKAFLPRRASERCGHQDLIELFGGNDLRIEGNRFGVYQDGGAQVYLTGPMNHVTVAGNLFVGTDPRLPLYRSRVGVLVGSLNAPRLPLDVNVLDNTILTGARRIDGYTGSIVLSPAYPRLPLRERPVVAGNVIGILKTPERVCNGARAFVANVVLEGRGCPARAQAEPVAVEALRRVGIQPPLDLQAILGPDPTGLTPP